MSKGYTEKGVLCPIVVAPKRAVRNNKTFLGGFFFRTVIHTKAISLSFKPSIRDEDADCCLDRLSLESPETGDTRDKPDADDKSDCVA